MIGLAVLVALLPVVVLEILTVRHLTQEARSRAREDIAQVAGLAAQRVAAGLDDAAALLVVAAGLESARAIDRLIDLSPALGVRLADLPGQQAPAPGLPRLLPGENGEAPALEAAGLAVRLEPAWLDRLLEPLQHPEVDIALLDRVGRPLAGRPAGSAATVRVAAPLPGWPLHLLAHRPQADIEAEISQTRGRLIGGTLGAVLLVVVLAWTLLERSLTHWLTCLAAATRRLAGGSAEALPDLSRAPRELGILAASIDRLGRRLAIERERVVAEQERLRRALGELEHLAWLTAHDLAEPVRKTRLLSDLLASRYRPDDPEAVGLLAALNQSGARLATLVDQLGALVRAGRTEVTAGRLELAPLARQVVAEMGEELAAAGAEVTVGPLPTVYAQADQMRQVLSILLHNALAYADPARRLRIDLGEEPAPPGWVAFAVADNGSGFDPAQAETVFLPFRRLHPEGADPSRPGADGLGMGLAICQRIIDRHGGAISAHPKPGVGTRMVIRLPDPKASAALPDQGVADP
ncbi:Histidine kinase-, DNA gyrase B-, and HSP90-like ATPase [Roseospirillum parvum]|uniref:histidine kinase n=2 Tax=Roseospirillum parvum TaxID=83401 RepID=A0A1G8G456_9PROT|nr:Histidine kinase-, DNA gyrase B-, and HSP90-like ATPase [Roseospirillum parvum]